MLLFLSSSARIRYRDDIIRVVALPERGHLQFRYDVSIVDHYILENTRSGRLVGQKALVCYAHTKNQGAPVEYIPCRLARITSAEIVGSSCIVVFQVEKYAEINATEEFVNRIAAGDRDRLPRWQRRDDSYHLSGHFALALSSDPGIEATGDQLDAFERVVKKLVEFTEEFGKAPGRRFFTVLGVDKVSLASAGQQTRTPVKVSAQGTYALESGEEYELRAYVFAPDKGPTQPIQINEIEVQSENKAIVFPLGTLQKIDSEYDVKRFKFQMEKNLADIHASLTLATKDVNAITESCEITIPVIFKGRASVGLIRVALIAVGSSGPAIIGAGVAGQLTAVLAIVMFVVALAAGVGTIFVTSGKS